MATGGQPQHIADVVDEQLRAALRDDDVKAVVFSVDSPGGSAVASDSIWRAVHQVREAGKPVVAQMGGVAASGGYYAAMGADRITALSGERLSLAPGQPVFAILKTVALQR